MALKKKHLFIPTVVSRVLDPPILLSILTMIGVFKSDISQKGFVVLGILLPLFSGVPLVFFFWLLKTRRIHDIDISNRKERIGPLLGLLVLFLIDIIVISFFDNPFLLHMFFLYFFWTLGFFLITLFWKISGHTGVLTLAGGMLVQWFGSFVLALFPLILLVAWARVVRKDHTPLQVFAGALYSLIILAIFSYWVY
jgi:membrane-associated phospholipid phosphatase